MSTKEQILSDREKALQFDETKRTLKDLEYENKILKAKIEKIKSILQKENNLSVRQLSIKTHSQWRTINKALKTIILLQSIYL